MKCNYILIMLMVFSAIATTWCFYNSQLSINNIKKEHETKLVIDSPEKAISYAKTLHNIQYQIDRETRQTEVSLNIKIEWKERAIQKRDEKYGTYWKVIISTSGVLPRYDCIASFTENGYVLTGSEYRNSCDYNK